MSFQYKNPITASQLTGSESVSRTSTFGSNFSVLQTGGYMEVYSLSDLNWLTYGVTSGAIQNSGNTIPIQFTKGTGTAFSRDVLTLNSDNMSSGRRRLGMQVFVQETETVYQYTIPNYETLWNNLSGLTSNSAITITEYTTTVNDRSQAGRDFINAWTGSTIEGVSGTTRDNARWRIFYGSDIQITGGTYFSGSQELDLYNSTGGTVTITGFTSGGGGNPLTVYNSNSGITATNVTGMTFSGASVINNGNGNVVVNFNGGTSSSGSTADISKIALRGWGTGFVVADNKIYTFNGTQGNTNWTRAVENATSGGLYGLDLMREVVFPNETGILVDSGSQSSQAYALFDNGNLWMWGYNGQGQLGIGNVTDQFYPVLSTTGVTQVYTHPSKDSRGPDFSSWYIKKTDGKVYGTGYNAFGQLGIGNTTQQNTWVEITAIGTNPIGVWTLGSNTAALVVQKSDKSIWVCGYNGFGQLGLGNTTATISTLTNTGLNWNGGDNTMVIQEIGFGGGFGDGSNFEGCCITMFLDNGTASRITSSGNNNWGNLGNGGTTQSSTPVLPNIGVGRIRKMVWAGSVAGSCWILKTDGSLWNWGYNGQGQLDRGNTTINNPIPAQVETGVVDILIHNHSWYGFSYQVASPIVRKSDGYYRCGMNNVGQIGDGTTTNRSNLVKMRFPKDMVIKTIGAISSTNELVTFYVVDTTNRIWAWGNNALNTIYATNNANVPVPVQLVPSVLIK